MKRKQLKMVGMIGKRFNRVWHTIVIFKWVTL